MPPVSPERICGGLGRATGQRWGRIGVEGKQMGSCARIAFTPQEVATVVEELASCRLRRRIRLPEIEGRRDVGVPSLS